MTGALLTLVCLTYGAEPGDLDKVYETHEIVYTGGDYRDERFKYRLMLPEKIEQGKTYPVVLFLHGAGERGSDNEKQLFYFPTWMAEPAMRAKYPCFVIAPQCRDNQKWVDVDWSQPASAKLPREPSDQMRVAMSALDRVLAGYPVDKNRIYLTGLSMGGYGSWDLAMRRPKFFAAVAPVCGGGDESQAALLLGTPIYAYHGDADGAVPVERTRRMIEALKEGGAKPKYKELPGVGHNSWTAAYRDSDGVVPWMFEQDRTDETKK
jgi:predicted peptidase